MLVIQKKRRDANTDWKEVIEDYEVKIGDGATIRMYSDKHACTIIDIAKNGSTITVQQDKAIRTDSNGMSDSQTYKYERDTSGKIETFKRTRKNKNVYTDTGKYDFTECGASLGIGYRQEYYDYSF